jgi:hypothetical protein
MDNFSQNQPNQQLQKSKQLLNVERIGARLLFGIVLLIFLLLVLNYFNIISLSSLFPNLFGFLPHKPLSS